jgi:type IV pilus assembly protein PilO
MALTEKERKQLMWLLMIIPVGAILMFWFLLYQPRSQEGSDMRGVIDSLQLTVDSARRDLASGTVEELRQRVSDFEAGLTLMRELVPTDNEVAALINDISDRAKLRSVTVTDLSPLGYENAGEYRVARYRFAVLGHYDEIGAFLSDIASLRRIMVPHGLALQIATTQSAKAQGDTTGALLQAQFQLKAFVKQPPVGEGEGGPGGAR